VQRPDPITEVVLSRGDTEIARWPLECGERPDMGAVDDLARLQLAARRLGWSVRLRGAAAVVTELLDLAGLTEVVPAEDALRQVRGQAEGGEEGGVEEVVMPDDPVA
jgi:hypothetical protein